MKVYIAGSSNEIGRVLRAVDACGVGGIEVTCTWPAVVAATPGGANPADATKVERCGWSNTDLLEVAAADLLWFLVPTAPNVTRGAWVEAGYAIGKDKLLVFSKENTKQSVFCALGDEFGDDVAALVHILEILTARKAGR